MEIGAIEVAFGPHLADWLMVALTAASVVAAALLGWLALKNGQTATDIAERAESARARELEDSRLERKQAAENQREFELQLKLDDALSAFFEATNRYLGALAQWRHDADEVENEAGPGTDPDEWPYPPRPSRHEIAATLETVLLRSREDLNTYLCLRSAVVVTLDLGATSSTNMLPELMAATREYRLREISKETYLHKLGVKKARA